MSITSEQKLISMKGNNTSISQNVIDRFNINHDVLCLLMLGDNHTPTQHKLTELVPHPDLNISLHNDTIVACLAYRETIQNDLIYDGTVDQLESLLGDGYTLRENEAYLDTATQTCFILSHPHNSTHIQVILGISIQNQTRIGLLNENIEINLTKYPYIQSVLQPLIERYNNLYF